MPISASPSPHRLAARGLALALLLLAGCRCPDAPVSYASPRDTLLTWQAQLCRDEVEAEYACLSSNFKKRMGGFDSYHAVRAQLLEEQPAAAYLLRRADLAEHIVEERAAENGREALLVLAADEHRLEIWFELETLVEAHFADRPSAFARLPGSVGEQLTDAGGATGLVLGQPRLTPEKRRQVRELHLSSRWQIADIAGLPLAGTPQP